jgi:NitT/TauT family transport system substrate-binding protein
MNSKPQNVVRACGRALCAWLALGTIISAATFAADAGTSQPLKKVAIAYSGISPSQAPAWIAYESGIFRKYGLDAQLILIESGSTTVQTLISGEVVAAQVAGPSVLQSNLGGSAVVMIAGFLNTMDYKFIVARDITRPDQLKGKAVAVSRIGSSSDYATRYALAKYGLTPDKDVTIVQIGSQPARFSALESGKIQGAMVAIPLTAKARKMGLNTLADLQMLGLEYQHTGLAVSQSKIKNDPELVRNILKAFVEGIHYMKTHRQEALAIMAKYLRTDDPDALQEAYESIGQALIPEAPYPTVKGIQIMLREMGVKDARARTARPEQFVDLSFIKELDSSGFIDRLYKSSAIAKANTRVESSPSPGSSAKEKAPVVEAKAKPTAAETKIKTAVRQISSAEELSSREGSPARTDMTGDHLYVVKSGDTLTKLAKQFYNSTEWQRIYEANRDILKNPNYIYIGMKLMIPMDGEAG